MQRKKKRAKPLDELENLSFYPAWSIHHRNYHLCMNTKTHTHARNCNRALNALQMLELCAHFNISKI